MLFCLIVFRFVSQLVGVVVVRARGRGGMDGWQYANLYGTERAIYNVHRSNRWA